MKKIYAIIVCLFFYGCAYAQVGIGTETPNTNAVLELKSPSSNQGLILPSLTTAQRTATAFTARLSASENGLLVFDKDENKFYYWQGNSWQVIVSGSITGGATGPAGGDLTGNYPAPQLAANVVGTAELADNGVTSVKINDGAVVDSKIASVAPSKLTAGGASTGQVLKYNGTNWTAQADNTGTGTVTNVATGAGLTGGPITATGTISLADNGVTSVKINDGAVVDSKIASVAPSKLTAGGALTGQVLKYNGTNWIAQADNAGTGTVTSVATGAGLTGGTITGAGTLSLADNGVTSVKINDGAVTTAKILDATITVNDLADNSVTNVKISDVAPFKLSADGAATGQVLKWNGSNWTPQADNGGGAGTVTNIATAGGLTGGPITASGTISIADGGVTSLKIADGSIVNNDINATAGIVDTKLATIATAGKVSGNAINSGTIGGTTAMNTSGTVITSGGIVSNTVGSATSVNVQSETGNAVYAYSTTGGRGVWAYSPTGIAVVGQSNSNIGVYGISNAYYGVYGQTSATASSAGVYGRGYGAVLAGEFNYSYSYGIYGYNSFSGTNGYLGGQHGVYGYSGTLGTGYAVYANGYAGGTSGWQTLSDKRYKRNINALTNSLSTVVRLKGVTYDFRYDEFPDKNFDRNRQVGLIAQEVLEVLPEVVRLEHDGYYSVSYEKIVPVLIEAIKELEQKVSILRSENEQLEELKVRLNEVEKLVRASGRNATALRKP